MWLLRQDAGPWTERDAAEFQAWLAQSAGRRAAYYRFKGAWQEAGRLRALLGQDVRHPETSAAAEMAGVPAPRRRHWRRILPRMATAAGLACILGIAAYLLVPSADVYVTPVGGMETVALPDGSRMTLNTDSRLHVDMDAADRRVRLRQGEAFFEVAKDPDRPFVVEAGHKRITAIGTAFSVRRNGSDVRVVVSEGRVQVESDASGMPRALKAPVLDAGMVANAQGSAVLVQARSPVEIAHDLSWRTGQLVFRDTPMAEAVAEFNRYNVRKLVIEDPAVAEFRVGGIFKATHLDAFVSLVQQGFPVQARVEEDRVVLTARK